MTTLLPRFPLDSPICRFCNWKPRFRLLIELQNLNGNAYRPYYICIRCKSRRTQTVSDHERGWISWDDDRGIRASNPNCDCGVPSRQDRAGVQSLRPGMGLWVRASGACFYYSDLRKGQTPEEAKQHVVRGNVSFIPWLW